VARCSGSILAPDKAFIRADDFDVVVECGGMFSTGYAFIAAAAEPHQVLRK
jgi:hypothetical protein